MNCTFKISPSSFVGFFISFTLKDNKENCDFVFQSGEKILILSLPTEISKSLAERLENRPTCYIFTQDNEPLTGKNHNIDNIVIQELSGILFSSVLRNGEVCE